MDIDMPQAAKNYVDTRGGSRFRSGLGSFYLGIAVDLVGDAVLRLMMVRPHCNPHSFFDHRLVTAGG